MESQFSADIAFARVIRVHEKCWRIPNDAGYSLTSMKSRARAIRHARKMFPSRPIKILAQGPMMHGRAELRLIEVIPAI